MSRDKIETFFIFKEFASLWFAFSLDGHGGWLKEMS